jgi:hypothetical protein
MEGKKILDLSNLRAFRKRSTVAWDLTGLAVSPSQLTMNVMRCWRRLARL